MNNSLCLGLIVRGRLAAASANQNPIIYTCYYKRKSIRDLTVIIGNIIQVSSQDPGWSY